MNVANHLPGFEAPIVGLIQNTFKKGKGKGIGSYADKIDNGVKLEPIFDDILGEHSREALQAFGTQLDEFSAEARGLLTNRTTQAKLPLRSMWLKDVHTPKRTTSQIPQLLQLLAGEVMIARSKPSENPSSI